MSDEPREEAAIPQENARVRRLSGPAEPDAFESLGVTDSKKQKTSRKVKSPKSKNPSKKTAGTPEPVEPVYPPEIQPDEEGEDDEDDGDADEPDAFPEEQGEEPGRSNELERVLLHETGIHEEDVHDPVQGQDSESLPQRKKIKQDLVERVGEETIEVEEKTAVPLQFLSDEKTNSVFIGRKKSVHKRYGFEGTLYVGKIEESELKEKKVYLDSLNPHVVFVCGARGSGKSYVLGVIAEELAVHNKNVGVIVIDPIGVFWSMRFPNKEEREVKELPKFDLQPDGLNNLKVFIPEGMKSEVPKNTFDATFSLQPSLLTGEDWCLTFGIDRFSPTGLLLEKSLHKVEQGHKTVDGKYVKAKGKKYSLNDLVYCLEKDAELNSREKGYKPDSIRALVSRFEAAKAWGIFNEKGTPLSELSHEGQMTILDTSFLDDTVTALVIGLLARRLLAARKISTRKEAAQKFKEKDVDELLELEVPPTWLFIDEAHTLIPSGNVKTPATKALVEYVKQGRRPGCSLVFATQQPSAIDTKVLSQLDVIMSHKLIFDDDIKAIYKRTPTIIPHKYKKANFLKTLPVGIALTGDRSEETSRAFVLRVRPRMSQHEGRDAETSERTMEVDRGQLQGIAVSMFLGKLEKEGSLDKQTVERVISTLNAKYKGSLLLSNVLDSLEEKGVQINPKTMEVFLPGYEPAQDETAESEDELGAAGIATEETKQLEKSADEGLEKNAGQAAKELQKAVEVDSKKLIPSTPLQGALLALPSRIDPDSARRSAERQLRKNLFGLMGTREFIKDLRLIHRTVWRVEYNYFVNKTEFVPRECFICSATGEFLHFNGNQFVESKGLKYLLELNPEEIKVLRNLRSNPVDLKHVVIPTGFDPKKARRILEKLMELNFVVRVPHEEKELYALNKEKALDLPPNPHHKLLESVKHMRFVQLQGIERAPQEYKMDVIPGMVQALWPQAVVNRISEVFRPLYAAVLEDKESHGQRTLLLDAFTGKTIQ